MGRHADDGGRRLGGMAGRLLSLVTLALIAMAALPALAQACTISWDGSVGGTKWFAFDPHDPNTSADDDYNWNLQRYPDGNDDVCFPSGSVASTDQVTQNTPTMRSFTISQGATLSITDVQLGAAKDSVNAGTLNMSAPVTNPANSAAVPLTIDDANAGNGDESLTNTGTINFPNSATSNGIRAIIGGLINQGTINVNTPEASIQRNAGGFTAAASHSNTGTINISPGNNLRVLSANLTNGAGGVITGGGSMSMSQVRFENASGSQIVGGATPTDVNMTNSVLAGTVGSTATGNIDVYGAFNGGGPSTLEGAVPPGIVVDIEPGVTLQSPAVDTTVNAGRININGGGAQLQVLPTTVDPNVSTSKLTNTGTIAFTADSPAAATGIRLITGDLVNQGTILVNDDEAGFQFPGGSNSVPKLTNQGTLAISSGSNLRVLSSTFAHGPSSVISGAGTMDVVQSRLEVSGNSQIVAPADVNLRSNSTLAGAAGAATGNIDLAGGLLQGGGPSTLEGTLPAGITLDLDSTTLKVPAVTTTVNAGHINLNGNAAEVDILPNDPNTGSTSKLTNTGTIEFTTGGTGGFRFITGNLVNQGSLLVNNPQSSFQAVGGTNTPPSLTNNGTITVSTGNALRLIQAPVFINGAGGVISGSGTINNETAVQNTSGTVAPGSSPGVLTITGDYVQGPGGTLAIDVSGASPGAGYDQLAVGGTASLAGTLNIATSGFTPSTGQQFKILDAPAPPAAPTVSGTFGTVQPTGGRTYTVAYNPTDVTLTADAPPVEQPPADDDGDGVPNASDNCPTVAGPASNGGCPVVDPPPPPPDDSACEAAQAKLDKAKAALKRAKKQKASAAKIEKAKKKLKKAKGAVKKQCD